MDVDGERVSSRCIYTSDHHKTFSGARNSNFIKDIKCVMYIGIN